MLTTDDERAAAQAIPAESRCEKCNGLGWRLHSRWSWRWQQFTGYQRRQCAECSGTGRHEVERVKAA